MRTNAGFPRRGPLARTLLRPIFVSSALLGILAASAALMAHAAAEAPGPPASASASQSAPVSASIPIGRSDTQTVEFMPVDQIKPGMKGVGRTVFHGYKPEPFDVEILGVEHNSMAGGDMILARISGPLLENHGVVAGMSGSPIYIDGKLIGALAYGWSFAYKPYCGITPISQMYSVFQSIGKPGLGDLPSGATSSRSNESGWDWQSAWTRYQNFNNGLIPASEAGAATSFSVPDAGTGSNLNLSSSANQNSAPLGGFKPTIAPLADEPGEMRPMSTPLFLSGASPTGAERLRKFFAARGMTVMSAGTLAGSASADPQVDSKLIHGEAAPDFEGGSSIGVPILSGDLSMSAIGTITYVQGDRLIGFGHPMFNKGGSTAPAAVAYIFGFLQNYQESFKLGEVGEVRGTIEQDRQFAIGGRIGPIPPRVPIRVEIEGPAASRPRVYNYTVWKNHEYIPQMTTEGFLEGYVASVAEGGKLTAQSDYTIRLGDGREIVKRFSESTDGAPIIGAALSMQQDLFMLLENPFQEGDVASISVKTHVEPGRRDDGLLTATTDHANYLAGSVVHVRARLRPWRGDEYERTFDVKLPADLKPGTFIIHLADASGQQRIAQTHNPGRFDPRNYEDVVRLVQSLDTANRQLRIYLYEPDLGIDVRGQALDGLPTTMQSLIQNTAPAQILHQSIGREVSVTNYDMPVPFVGTQSLMIQVVDHFDE